MCTIQHSWFYSDFFAKHLGELSSWIVVFGPCRALRGENTISKRCVQFTILDSILIFLPNIWVSYQVGLLSLGPEGGEGTISKSVYNSTFLILSWFLCQTFGGVFKFDCCLWAKRTITKMCEQFNILDFILIFVPNSWGSYRVGLLFLGPQILKCLYTSTFLILSWFCANNLGECSSWIVVCEPCGGGGHNF